MASSPTKDVDLRIRPLDRDQIDQAFASLELRGVPLSLEAWQRYARDRIGAGPSKAGVLSVQCDRAYVHGLLGYVIMPFGSACHMTVDLFQTVGSLSDRAAGSLLEAAEAIAFEQRCAAIHFDLPDFADASIIALKPRSLSLLCQNGYAVDAIQLSKTIDG